MFKAVSKTYWQAHTESPSGKLIHKVIHILLNVLFSYMIFN